MPTVKECSTLDVDVIVQGAFSCGTEGANASSASPGSCDPAAAAGWCEISPSRAYYKGPSESDDSMRDGTVVKITAVARCGYDFTGWQGQGTVYTGATEATPGMANWIVDDSSATVFQKAELIQEKTIYAQMSMTKQFSAVFTKVEYE